MVASKAQLVECVFWCFVAAGLLAWGGLLMDPLTCVFWLAFALILLGMALHPAFGIAGFAVMILGGLWATS